MGAEGVAGGSDGRWLVDEVEGGTCWKPRVTSNEDIRELVLA